MKAISFADTASTKPTNATGDPLASLLGRTLLLLSVILVMPSASILRAQTPNTVALAPDTCPEVRDGDIVTFVFTPQFDVPSAVYGLRNIELKFLHGGQSDPVNAPEGQFTLHAIPRRGEHEAPDAPMVTEPNGPIQFRFRTNLRSTARGVFYLVAVTGDPILVRGYVGDIPKIINAPLREHLCLQVAPPY